MKPFVTLIAFFSLSAMMLPSLVDARDDKKETKADDDKKDKKAEPKKKAVPMVDEIKVLNAPKLLARVKEVRNDETNTEVQEVVFASADQLKHLEYLKWEKKFRVDLQTAISLETQKKLDPVQRDEVFRRETASKLNGVFSGELKTVNVTPALRVRTAAAPPQFDATGAPKKLTASDLTKLKKGSRLPGYPTDIGAVRAGQIVELSVPASALQPAKKQATPRPAKKGIVDADPNLAGGVATPTARIDAYLIYIIQE
jgi:hypothetical protein